MVSAMDCTCEELTGSGNDATAASIASFMMPMISGENDAFEKSCNGWSFFKGQKRISKLRPQDGHLEGRHTHGMLRERIWHPGPSLSCPRDISSTLTAQKRRAEAGRFLFRAVRSAIASPFAVEN